MDFNENLVLKVKVSPDNVNRVTPAAFDDNKGNMFFEVPEFADGIDDAVESSHTDLPSLLQFSGGLAAYKDKIQI